MRNALSDQWAEEHGIHVGYCNRHKVKVWDETCDRCLEEEAYCPECNGTNLNEERTVCWDCTASDYE